MYKDNGFGDAFAKEFSDVMNSKEHKAIFEKTASKKEAQLGEVVYFGEEQKKIVLLLGKNMIHLSALPLHWQHRRFLHITARPGEC